MVCCLSVQSSLNFSLSCTLVPLKPSSSLGFLVRLAVAKFRGPHYGSTSSITSSAFWPSSNTLDLRCQWKKSGKTDGWVLGAGDPADYLCRDFHCVRAQDHVHG